MISGREFVFEENQSSPATAAGIAMAFRAYVIIDEIGRGDIRGLGGRAPTYHHPRTSKHR